MPRTSIVNTAVSRFRPSKWLQDKGYAPHVYMFRNLERGQVVYTQFPLVSQRQINLLFQRPNWDNKKPSTRRDLWKCMAVINLRDYDKSIQLFQNLGRLRYLRDILYAKENYKLRKKNEFGRVWYSGLFRPTFSQEAVADLRESLLKLNPVKDGKTKTLVNKDDAITIYWEDPWRMGDVDKYWKNVLPNIEHEIMKKDCNTFREESTILKDLSLKSLNELKK